MVAHIQGRCKLSDICKTIKRFSRHDFLIGMSLIFGAVSLEFIFSVFALRESQSKVVKHHGLSYLSNVLRTLID